MSELDWDRLEPARRFREDIVAPTVAAFLAQPDDKRLGCLACLVLASLTEHYLHAQGNAHGKKAFFDAHPILLSVGDVANAVKHVVEKKNGACGRKWPSYETLGARGLSRAGCTRAGDRLGARTLFIGSDRVVQIVTAAMLVWRGKLDPVTGCGS